ncbi:MAG: EamA family transporter [Rhodoferax sp.]
MSAPHPQGAVAHAQPWLTHRRAVLLMVLVTFLWSTAGVVTRHLEHARSFEVTFWRSFFTVLSLLVLLPLTRGRDVFWRLRHAGWPLWAAGVCWSAMFTFFMVAMMLTTVANVLITLALAPLLTALAAWLFLGHAVPRRTWWTIAAAGVGIATMYAQQFSLGAGMAGMLVALCVPVAGAANWTLNHYAQTHGRRIDLIPAVWVGAVISSGVTLPLAWPFAASAWDLQLLAGLGLFQLAIPCVLVVVCTRVLPSPEVALLGLLEVIFGIALAWLGADEVPRGAVLVGGALVIGALVVNEWMGWRQRQW